MKVELCTQAQKEEALDVLCDAFHEYPVMRYVLADSGPDYDGDLRALIDLFCQARLTHGLSLYGIRHEGPLVAVSVHQRPHRVADVLAAHNSRPDVSGRPRRLMIYSHCPASAHMPFDVRNGPSRLRESPYESEYMRAVTRGDFKNPFAAPTYS